MMSPLTTAPTFSGCRQMMSPGISSNAFEIAHLLGNVPDIDRGWHPASLRR
jgi:hypothetical protein